ncbi:GH36-type glycosyl hydrolase domain-containing protein [Parasphingorhabdus sp.]|uniref:GH36-type glycosyl hydrolase domain-containing protein n=1 Tax=Parasphingorhabdus sp. TaxID=2709688 RepID=UPI003A907DB5
MDSATDDDYIESSGHQATVSSDPDIIVADDEGVGGLERAAAVLHDSHKLAALPAKPVPAWKNIDQADEWLTQARTAAAQASSEAGKAAEWLLDNDYQIYRAIRQIKQDLPSSFYEKLPALEADSDSGFPRVFSLAHGLLLATKLQVTLPGTIQFICAYQRITPLTIAELWAFPTMLRIACLEILVSSLTAIFENQIPQPFAPTKAANAPYSLDDTERVARSIANLSLIASISWEDFFDQTSHVEKILKGDPAQYYSRMDFETRDRYRRAVEILASYSDISESDLATEVIRQADAANPGQGKDHVGYWLIGNGRRVFEKSLGVRPPLGLRLRRAAFDHAGPIYSIALLSFWIGALLIPALYLLFIEVSLAEWIGALLVMLIPASILSISLVQRLVTLVVPPKALPKLDFTEGLPDDCSTIVIIPAIVAKPDEVSGLIQQIETHWIANRDSRLQVALLADLADADAAEIPGDEDITGQLVDQVRSLNRKHGKAHISPFHVLCRPRQYNRSENCWMAWERKRGKLEQFNRLLMEDDDRGFSLHEGDRAALANIRFVVTVDADTVLPTGSVAKMAGTLAHPQNQAYFDDDSGQMVSGYSILQPRVEMAPQNVSRTFFTRFFAGDTAIDIYSRAVSNVYQDLFGSGSFIGKGIYDVAAFYRCIDGRIAENSVLSHDLLEGALGRVGLASDIILYEGFPGTYLEYVKRWHRWVRGDWQLLPWLHRSVRGTAGLKRASGLSGLDIWKIIDNLRRSLVQPSLLIMVIVGWLFLPGNPWFWTLLTIFAHAGQLFTDLVTGLAQGRRRGAVRGLFAQLTDQSGRWFLTIAYLPYESVIAVHAIGITLWRSLISHKNLLQWTTAAHETERQKNLNSRAAIWRRMWPGSAISVSLGLAIQIINPSSMLAALPLLMLWFVAPEITVLLNRPRHKPARPLGETDKLFLRELARRTWLYFETFAGPQDNWLPPDNFQGEPHPEIAHRTSPTNIGMMMLSTATAWDLGYLGKEELAARTDNSFASLDRLETHRGHFLNWYDTLKLQPLEPRYVSVVDSGNLAGCLLAYAVLLRDIAHAPAIEPQRWAGLDDALRLFAGALQKLPDGLGTLEADVATLRADLDQIAAKPLEWHAALTMILETEIVEFEKQVGEAAIAYDSIPTASLRELHSWLERSRHHLQAMKHDIENYAPWLRIGDLPSGLVAVHQEVMNLLNAGSSQPVFDRALGLLINHQTDDRQEKLGLQSLGEALKTAQKNHHRLSVKLKKLSLKTMKYADRMEFAPLYDRERRLFHIGYNVSSDRLDPHHYDLLASEARLASYFAIARQDVPVEHWFHLGRPVMRSDNGLTLISWNGSMFEYLMPRLLMRSGPNTLLYESEKVAVKMHQAYGRSNQLPWGISESAYSARDPDHRYQYQAFGVPGLGLRRGLAKDVVVAPYASALALQITPADAVQNLRLMDMQGLSGLYGMFEAADYTPERLQDGRDVTPVNAYMAHHQGMLMCAIGNSLCDDILVRRFEQDPRVSAVSLLLNERVPQELPSEVERIESIDLASRQSAAIPALQSWRPELQTASPQTLLLGNGSLSSCISTGGGGGLRWRHHALTRFLADPVQDAEGLWIYLYDQDEGSMWSATRQPTGHRSDQYDVTFHSHMAEYHRRDHDISLSMEVVVAVGDDLEIRRLNIGNLSDHKRNLRITSYGEVVLAPPLDDERHPAFSKLFVGSEYIPEIGGQLFTRRPRNPRDAPPVLLHFIVSDDEKIVLAGHESDRRQFVGRNGSLRRPAGAGKELSGTTGWTLDPIMSLQVQCSLEPFEHTQFCLVTIAAATREGAIEIAERYATVPSLDWAINDAESATAHQIKRLGIPSGKLPVLQQLGSLLAYPHGKLRADPERIRQNRWGQPNLWGLAISGDYPILMLKAASTPSALLADVIRAHQLWRAQGLEVDLVIMQSAGSGYIEPVRDDLMELLHEVNGQWMLGRNAGVHLLFADQIGADQVRLVEAVSRVIIDDQRGPLEDQLARAFQLRPSLPHFEPARFPVQETAAPKLSRPKNLLIDNGFGGFAPDGREYVIHLEPEDSTPAPWVNILANAQFGCAVTEAGGGFTWAINSGENRITPWTNDAVTDEPSEVLYLRDEETAEVWTPTPEPRGREAACQIRHGAGYTEWRKISHGLEQELRIFVPVDDPVKIVRLHLTNHTERHRRVTATYYVNWLLGALRSVSREAVQCSYDPELQAILASNSWNPDFAERVAFLTANRSPHGLTTDRQEFVGREGNLDDPAGLRRWGLEGAAETGTDPCGAYQVHIELEPGASEELIFLVGQGDNDKHARSLIAEWKKPDQVDSAFRQLNGQWDDLLGAIEVHTPEPGFDFMINRWLLYQSMASRILARAGFYQASGAIGYRDQLQDVMAFLHNDPQRARAHILACAAHQFEEGDVLHWWHPPSDRGVRTRCSDDLLWLPYTVCQYVEVTGDETILYEEIPYLQAPILSADEADRYSSFERSVAGRTLLDHCIRALDRGVTRGRHGIPLIGAGDWNDGMDRVGEEGKGESVWLAWFAIVTANAFAALARRIGQTQIAETWSQRANELRGNVEETGWDGDWYRRAFDDDGLPWGSAENVECRIDSISQSWALFAGADPTRTRAALDAAYRELVDHQDQIARLLWPPFEHTPRDPGYIKAYPSGIRENGGQYSHAATWLGIAFARLGDAEKAMEVFNMLSPIKRVQNREQAERYRVEPYVVAADIAGGRQHGGRGGWTWYTGAAAWTWRLGVEEILGLKLRHGKLVINPCLPGDWDGYSAILRQPGGSIALKVERHAAGDKVGKLVVDGVAQSLSEVQFPVDGSERNVIIRMAGAANASKS